MNAEAQLVTPPSIFINIEAINVHTPAPKPLPNLLTLALAQAVTAGAPPANDSPEGKHPALAPMKILADGTQVPASDTRTDHVAILFPDTGWMVGVNTLHQGDNKPFKTQQDAEAAAKSLTLLGFNDWELANDVVYSRHVIDRRFHKPAADPNLYPHLLLNDTYWTSTIAPWSESSAFYVNIGDGGFVNYDHRYSSGFGLPCRRARQ